MKISFSPSSLVRSPASKAGGDGGRLVENHYFSLTNDMRPADSNLIDSYMGVLNSLSPENKLELISKLSNSLDGSIKPTGKSISDLYGAFISKKSADEILSDLRASRNLSRQ